MAKRTKEYKQLFSALILIFVMVVSYFAIPGIQAAPIASREMRISNSIPGFTLVKYDFEGDHSLSTVRCLRLRICTTASGSCTVPTGLLTTGGAKDSANWSGWTAASWTGNFSTNGDIRYTNATGEGGGSNYSFATSQIINPSSAGTYFARVNTYSNTDCSTGPIDDGVAAFAIIDGVGVTATVAETLTFSISGVSSGQSVNGATTNIATSATSVDFGELSTSVNKIGANDLTVSTNAAGGYTTAVSYLQKLRIDASNDIDDHTGTNSSPTSFPSPGNEAFGYTTNDSSLGTGTPDRFTSSGGNKWAAFTTSLAEVAYNAGPVANETTRTGYQVGISGTTAGGAYSTLLIYVATPIF